jgi:hypothetical protein
MLYPFLTHNDILVTRSSRFAFMIDLRDLALNGIKNEEEGAVDVLSWGQASLSDGG